MCPEEMIEPPWGFYATWFGVSCAEQEISLLPDLYKPSVNSSGQKEISIQMYFVMVLVSSLP